jgi:hypothetical protein
MRNAASKLRRVPMAVEVRPGDFYMQDDLSPKATLQAELPVLKEGSLIAELPSLDELPCRGGTH